ncbi:hypothetical protein LCGC14_3045850, partial [marine sediment metagenome]
TTQLELDAVLLLDHNKETYREDKNGEWKETLYTYEDDKIIIKSNMSDWKSVPYWEDSQPNPYDRQTRFLNDGFVIDIWINTNPKTLVYHSENSHYKQWRSIRGQDEYRKNLTYHKGKWVKYLKDLSKTKKKKLYKTYKKQLKEHKKWSKEKTKVNKQKDLEEFKRKRDIAKEEKERLEKIEKKRLQEATTLVDDKELFKK